MPISASNVIEPAFRHTKEQLTGPFRFSQWWRLAVVGLLAGEMGSYGGCNFSYPTNTQHPASQPFPNTDFPAYLAAHHALIVGLGAALIVVGIALWLLFTYISSVMRFILFDSIIARECHIREGWTRRRAPGQRLFVWRICFGLAAVGTLLVVVGIAAICAWRSGWFTHASDHVLGLVLGGLALFFFFFVFVVFFGVVTVMTKDFVVPQMALENITAMEGWRRLWLWMKYDKGGYAGYIVMKIVLAIAVAIVLAIIIIVVFLVLLIVMGAFGVAIYFGGKAAGWTWNPYTISLAVVLGCIAFAIFVFVAALISVPATVFFQAYSIYFFAPRYSQLASLLRPESSAPAGPPAPAAPA